MTNDRHQVRIVKATRLFMTAPLTQAGEVVEVDTDTYHRLTLAGIAEPIAPAVQAPVIAVHEPEPEEQHPAPTAPRAQVERPKRAANIDAWKAYADSLGINYSKLTKQQIIAACNHTEETA